MSNQRDRGRGLRARRGGAECGSKAGGPRLSTAAAHGHDLLHSDLAREPISRWTLLMGFLGLGVCAAVAKLSDYQIINARADQIRADQRRVSSQVLQAKRGCIYDRNGNVLASSVDCQNVYVNPRLIKRSRRRAAVRALVSCLGVDETACAEKVARDTTFVYIKRQVDQDVADKLLKLGIKGIETEPATKRVYTYGNLASQVLGVVNIDNKGVSGLEKRYDDLLSGKNGSIVRERARDGSFIAGGAYRKVAAHDGSDIVTTLDINIQRVAEDALATSVQETSAHYGSAIVTDPRSGEILAICSCPTYDQLDLAHTQAADMNLRVVTDAYEPGSVFKSLVSGAALDLGIVTPDTEFAVPARVKVGDDWVTDADKRTNDMTMTLREIMRRSSNTGMVLVGTKIGADNFAAYLEKYGIGVLSGIDYPGESRGIVRPRDKYDGSSLGSMSFGQGISVAPIEITRAVGGIANKGVMVTPHLLKAKGGENVDWSSKEVRVISESAAALDVSMMITVVDEGTGKGGQVAGYEVAGKTGTAQRASQTGGYQKDSYMASFMGFAPARQPRALVYITLDGTPKGSDAAATPFRTIMTAALATLGVQPSR